MINEKWSELYNAAMEVLKPRKVSEFIETAADLQKRKSSLND